MRAPAAPATAGLALDAVTVVRLATGGRQHAILSGLAASFPAGTATLVSGRTGSGKSTLVHLLAGLARPSSGLVLAAGRPISRWLPGHRDLYRREVGLLLQQPFLLGGLSALENVMTPLVPRAGCFGGPAGLERLAHEALEAAAAADLAPRRPATLSGGERQRVALARALVGRRPYLLLDEPTSQQDDEGAAAVLEAAEAALERGATVVVVTHDPRASGWPAASARFRLEAGALVREG